MSAEHQGRLGSNVFFEDYLPVRWRILTQPPHPRDVLRFREENEFTLRYLHLTQPIIVDPKEDSSLNVEMRRVEIKLDLLMNWAARILMRDEGVPEHKSIRMHQNEICWQCGEPFQINQWVEVVVYTNRHIPQPLIFRGMIKSQEKDEGMKCIAFAQAHTPEYEKFLFRNHRRQIAQAKEKRDGN